MKEMGGHDKGIPGGIVGTWKVLKGTAVGRENTDCCGKTSKVGQFPESLLLKGVGRGLSFNAREDAGVAPTQFLGNIRQPVSNKFENFANSIIRDGESLDILPLLRS